MVRKFVLASVVAAAISAPAFAADLPVRGPALVGPVAYPMYNWTGLYVGLHAGYGWGNLGGATSQTGGLVGGQIGFNWQGAGSPFVLGVELDSAWADIEQTATAAAFGLVATATSKTNYLGSLRVRAGYAWDRALLYVTGGAGWANNTLSATVAGGGFAAGASSSNTHFGWTLGAGLEYAFAGPWSAKLEYLYYGLDSQTYFGVANANLKISTVKLGVNYRFGM